MNQRVLNNKYYEKFGAFKEAVLGFLQILFDPSKEIHAILQKRITDTFHVIG